MQPPPLLGVLPRRDGDDVLAWTRTTDPDEAHTLLPAWLGRRLVGLHGRFGLLLNTGDVMRITTVSAVHQSTNGVILLDVSLDSAGVPDGLDLAWRSKHFLGAPVPGATAATVNLAQVVAAVEFVADVPVERPEDVDAPTSAESVLSLAEVANQIQAADSEPSTEDRAMHVGGGASASEMQNIEQRIKEKKPKKRR
jgi:hypothetical protein